MRSRHFDLLSTSNDSVEYIKIITSVTKQLKNYQVRSQYFYFFLIVNCIFKLLCTNFRLFVN